MRKQAPKKQDGKSKRTEQVIVGISLGKTTKEIAFELGIASKTVEYHWQKIKSLYRFWSVIDAAHYALSRGWVRNKYDTK